MQIILEVEIYCSEYQGNIGVFQKEFDSDILPSLGMKILDTAFEGEPREIKEIVVRYEEDWCLIKLNPQKIDKKEHLEVYKTMYEPNGWKWSG
jgi:hypothetical protein